MIENIYLKSPLGRYGIVLKEISVNNAYLSWEAVYRLKHLGGSVDLLGADLCGGGDSSKRHGIILAKSLPAKACGIQTGESLMEARQKCPGLLDRPAPLPALLPVLQCIYGNTCGNIRPDVEQYSIDEAFMDMSGTGQLWGEPHSTADAIRERIERELGFTVNIGISENKLLAKMASDFRKPNRTHTLFPEEIPPENVASSGHRPFFS